MEEVRLSLLSTGISLGGNQIVLKDRNPYQNLGMESIETTRLFIRNVPLSYDNSTIEKALKDKGINMLGHLKDVRARTLAGKLTNFKTGDRFVDIELPTIPLSKKMSVGAFTASLYHKEQIQSLEHMECGNCKQVGHKRRDCPNDPVCYDCGKSGHKKGSQDCGITKGLIEQTDESDNEEA